MRKSFYPAATLLLGALAACATETSAPVAPEVVSSAANAVSNPNTPVNAQVTISVGGSIVYRSEGPSNNGLGTCLPVGRYYNPQGKKTSEKEHPQCATVTPATEITVTFNEVANYVLPSNGNVNLNFNPAAGCDPLTDPLGCGRAIQYKKNQDVTTGAGILATTETAHGTGVWTIDLGTNQPFATTGNNLVRTGTPIIACNATLGCHPGMMSW